MPLEMCCTLLSYHLYLSFCLAEIGAEVWGIYAMPVKIAGSWMKILLQDLRSLRFTTTGIQIWNDFIHTDHALQLLLKSIDCCRLALSVEPIWDSTNAENRQIAQCTDTCSFLRRIRIRMWGASFDKNLRYRCKVPQGARLIISGCGGLPSRLVKVAVFKIII